MQDIFIIRTFKEKIKRESKQVKSDDAAVKRYLVSECLKITLYSKGFLQKLNIKQLRWLISNYKKRHFKDIDKDIIVRRPQNEKQT
jgi:uncharacterized protein Smg (DUF494 family)